MDNVWLTGGAVFFLALFLSLLFCWIVIRLQIMDAPDGERKMQIAPVASSGGIGMVVGALAALVVAALFLPPAGLLQGPLQTLAPYYWGAGLCFLVIGVLDDRFTLGAKTKLYLLGAVCFFLPVLPPDPDFLMPFRVDALEVGLRSFSLPLVLAVAGTGLWLLVVVNATNFMDGSNGMAMGSTAFMGLTYAVLALIVGEPGIAVVSLALVGAMVGFLIWNLAGKLYAGDSGAYAVSFLTHGAGLLLISSGKVSVWIAPMVFMPFLADVLLTLYWRARNGRALMEAHTDHIYQIALRAGLTHGQVASVYMLFTFHVAMAAVITTMIGGRAPQIAFLLSLVVFVLMFRRLRRAAVSRGMF